MKDAEDEAFDDLAKKQGDWGGGFKAKQAMAADKYSDIVSDGGLDPRNKMDAQPAQEPPSEWAGIKAVLDEYGLQAIDFVADFKAALAQPAQEPVGYVYSEAGVKHGAIERDLPNGTPLYAASPQRPWVGLTDEEAKSFINFYKMDIVRFVEAKLKEKNNGT